MKRLGILSIIVTLSVPFSVHAQSGLCEQVMVPTYTQSHSDYRQMQSFMSLYSDHEYDRLQKMSAASRSAEASYKFFQAEYDDSQTSSEFRDRVRDRLSRENFQMAYSETRSYAKRELTDAQVQAWTSCVQNVTGRGAFSLGARNVTKDGFTLIASRVMPAGTGEGQAEIEITGGHLGNGTRKVSESYKGLGSVNYQVIKDQGAQEVRVSGNMSRAFADDFVLDYTPARRGDEPRPRIIINVPSAGMSGGYVRRDATQDMIVSAEMNGGPSENVTFTVEAPVVGDYDMDAMWAAGDDLELWVYSPPPNPGTACWVPVAAPIHYYPTSTGGWDSQHLAVTPVKLGRIVLHKGRNMIVVMQRPCGGGKGGGRLPSIKWIRLTEVGN